MSRNEAEEKAYRQGYRDAIEDCMTKLTKSLLSMEAAKIEMKDEGVSPQKEEVNHG